MNTENLSTLKIHKLTQEQYNRELASGNIDETALYLTPEEESNSDETYATQEDLNAKADREHTHTVENVDGLQDTLENLLDKSSFSDHTSNKSNPHGVTASQVGLGNVPNVSTNNQTPTYTASSTLTSLASGEKLSIAFGKIAKAITDFISHLANKSNPHEVTASQVGALTSDDIVDNLESTSTTLPLSAKQGNILKNKTLGCYSARGSESEFNIPASEVTIVPLTQFIAHSSCIGSSGTSDGFELNEKGGVIVPFNGHILVSGCIHFRTHGKQVTRGCYIKRGYMVDSTTEITVEVGSQYITDPEGKLSNISSGAIIVPVSDGDIIYLCARSSEATKCSLTEVATQLNITYINYN